MHSNVLIQEAVAILREWGRSQAIVSEVYIFGSRVKGVAREDSDLDVAVRLVFADPDTSLAHWMAHQKAWSEALESLIPYKIDLQLFHPGATPIISSGLQSAAIVAFSRSEATFS